MNLKKLLTIFMAAILTCGGICVSADEVSSEPTVITVAANAANVVSSDGIVIGSSGRVEAEKAGYITFGFNIEEAGYYNLDCYASFWYQNDANGADVSISIDDGKLINWSKNTLSALTDAGEAGMRTHKMLDTFYFSKGSHTLKFVTEYRNNPSKAIFNLAKFTLTKTDTLFVSATGSYGETTWSSDGWNQISTGELGSGEYTVYVAENGTYSFLFNMDCILNDTARAVPYLKIDDGAETEFSLMNMVATGDKAGVAGNIPVYEYITPVELTKGTHKFTLTTKKGPNDNSMYFFFTGFSIKKKAGGSAEPKWDGYLTVPAIGRYTVENNLRVENGNIATGNLGKIVYKIEIPHEAYFDLDMDIGWTVTDSNAGANCKMQIDGRKSVMLTADNTEFVGDGDIPTLKNYKYTKQIRLDEGEHLISFETSVGINPYSAYFWFGGFTITEAENNGTATDADEEDEEDEDIVVFSPDLSIAASEGTASGGFFLENKCHWATNDPGEVEFEITAEKSGLYYLYTDCKTSGNIWIKIDDGATITFDSQMKKCKNHCEGRCTYHSRYKYCVPINLEDGTHKVVFGHENGTTYLGGFDFEYIGEYTGNYGAILEKRGIKVGRTTVLDCGNQTTEGVYADDDTFTATYTTDNAEIATVSKDGTVTAVSVGKAVITVNLAFANGETEEYSSEIYVLPYKKGRIAITDVNYNRETGKLDCTVEAFYDQKNTELMLITAVYGKSGEQQIMTSLKSFEAVNIKGLSGGNTKDINAGTYKDAEIIKLFITDTSGKMSPLFEYRVK